MNASAAVYETLEFLIDRNSKHILNIGTYTTDTIDFKIQGDDDLIEQETDNQKCKKFWLMGNNFFAMIPI